MGLRRPANASFAPLTEEEKLAQIAQYGFLQSPLEDETVAQQPAVIEEPPGSVIALGEAEYPEISAEQNQPVNPNQAIIDYIRAQKEQAEPYLKQQESGLNELRNKIKNYENQKQELNVAPILAYADSINGTNLAKSYQAPETQSERALKTAGLYKELQSAQNKAVDDRLKQIQDKLLSQQLLAGQKTGAMDNRLQNRMDFQAHKSVVENIKKDPTQKAYLTQLRNLDNAASIVANAKSLTPQQIDEFQQSVRSNLGIKGTSGVGEREKTMLNSLGLNAERWAQFLSGSPAEISKNDALVMHIKDLANVESANIKDQMKARLDVLSGGFGSVYERRPDYAKDLKSLLSNAEKQLQTKALGESQEPAKTQQPSMADIQAEIARRKLGK